MQIIHDKEQIQKAAERLRMDQIISFPSPPYAIHSYEKGELLVTADSPSRFLMWGICGQAKIYHIRQDSSLSPVALLEGAFLIGDMEFCEKTDATYFVEAITDVQCLALDIALCRCQLENDNCFLRYLLDVLSMKLDRISRKDILFGSLKEKVLAYLALPENQGRLQGVDITTNALGCSRRQLQRVLKELCEDGILIREKKGSYRMR